VLGSYAVSAGHCIRCNAPYSNQYIGCCAVFANSKTEPTRRKCYKPEVRVNGI